jgi:hypothetical protein
MNKVCYTAIIGKHDNLKEPLVKSPGWDLICFTDQDLVSENWQIIKVQCEGDKRRLARRIKILFYEYITAKYSFWLDASFQINVDLNKFWERFWHAPFSVPRHPIRDCVYREIRSCIANRRGNEEELIKQWEHYKKIGVPAANGIITSGVMMREDTDSVRRLCASWYDEISLFSNRDQVAFAKVSLNYNVPTYKWDYSHSKELIYFKHL